MLDAAKPPPYRARADKHVRVVSAGSATSGVLQRVDADLLPPMDDADLLSPETISGMMSSDSLYSTGDASPNAGTDGSWATVTAGQCFPESLLQALAD